MTDKLVENVVSLPSKRRHTSRFLMLLLIFCCGVVVGAAGGGAYMRVRLISMLKQPEKIPDRVLPRVQYLLSLTDEQSRKAEEIIRRRYALMESARAETYAKQIAEFDAMQQEVATILTTEQRVQWIALCESVEQRFLPVRQ